MRQFRFGVVFTGDCSAKEWAELAQRVESDAFSVLLVADHFLNPMACGPLILAAANATTTLRVGSYVYDNDFRHPALLAKEAATIDVLSGGRFEFGIGAGWAKQEYDAVGIPFDSPAKRVDRFEEAVGVITRLIAGETVDHVGPFFEFRNYVGRPASVQQPVPLLIGGGGARMLGIAGRLANIVGFVPRSRPEGGLDMDDVGIESMNRKIGWLEAGAEGRADGGPERSVIMFSIHASLDRAASPEVSATSPFFLVGDTSAMVDQLLERRERWGLSYIVCFDRDLELFTPVVRALAGT